MGGGSASIADIPTTDPDQIDFVSPEVQELRIDWALIDALRTTRQCERAGGGSCRET